MIRLYLARHGTTELNKSGVYYGSTDCSLSEEGLAESKAIAEALKDKNVDIIISSNLKRTLETSEIIKNTICKEKTPIEIVEIEEFRELDFGRWEKLHYKDVEAQYPKEWKLFCEDWKNGAPPEGESFMVFYERVIKGLTAVLEKYEDKNILIVAHQGVLRIILSKLICNSEDLYWNFTFSHKRYSELEIIDNHCNIIKINCGR
ncbi:MAG: histidine phosphatase family protein [Clostridiaceae bacterium]